MIKIEKHERYSTMVEKFEGVKFVINLPLDWKLDGTGL